eukprot:TRINITY_DN3472_c0_g1_i3.p1 TRINITY_DN3472_c0_g1~~TRINITY_DN3472_c0_g1_i3.p1  ORF type:complete len:552 (-),score=116.62 TRINITY_DN3472_c0_g1_i3:1078-2559(-)
MAGVPSFSESYAEARNKLVQAEYKESLSGQVTLSSKEQIASSIFSQLQQKEALIMGDKFPPAFNFFDYRGYIDNSSVVFPLLRSMPKGSVLHVHTDSAGSYDYIVYNSTYSPYAYIYTLENNTSLPYGSLHFFPSPPVGVPGWVTVPSLRSSSPNATQFDVDLLRNLTMRDRDYGDYLALWTRFDGLFAHVGGAFSYIECARGYVRHIFLEMIQDGVLHLELRSPVASYTMYDLKNNTYSFEYFLNMVQDIVVDIQTSVNPHFSVGVIVSIIRSVDVDTAYTYMYEALQLRNKYPGFILGFDLVGPEDEGNSLLYFLPAFFKIQNISSTMQYDLPYFFHAGETLFSNNTNLYDAILLNTHRIGHGLQLQKHPILMDIVLKNKIGIEICPISNQLLEYTPDMRLHPGFEYFNRGLPITISPDDPALYGYGGVSYDYYFVTVGWTLDLAGVKQLVLNSMLYSAFPDDATRTRTYNEWTIQWDNWIDNIIQTYNQL